MSNPLGLHAMVLTPEGDVESVAGAIRTAAAIGYDLVEVPILDPTAIDAEAARATADEVGIGLSASLGLDRDTDVSSTDSAVVDRGVERLVAGVDAVATMGATWMCGVLYSALGRYAAPPTSVSWDNAVAALRRVAEHAGERDVRIGLEVVNRYESNLVNTIGDGLRFLDEVGSDRCWMHVDTYHALIEEESVPGAIREAGDRLGYVHVGQNDRGRLASGTVDVDGTFAAIREVGFDGPVTFEAFSRATAAEGLANTLAIWRSPWDDGEAVARDALATMRDLLVDA